MGPETGGFHAETGYYAGGFRPGDIVLQTFAYHLVPAGHEIDESLQLIGCVVVPSGTGNTETQIEIAKAVGATGFVGTPSFLMTLLKRAEEMKVGPPAVRGRPGRRRGVAGVAAPVRSRTTTA